MTEAVKQPAHDQTVKRSEMWTTWHDFALCALRELIDDYVKIHEECGFDVDSRDGHEMKNPVYANASLALGFLEQIKSGSNWHLPMPIPDMLQEFYQ